MTHPEVSLEDIDIAIMTLKENGGIAALSGILRCEIALILPDGNTTLFSHFRKRRNSALQHPDFSYIGVMRETIRHRERRFEEVPPDTIDWGDKLVLRDPAGVETVRPTIHGLQNRFSGYFPVFES